MSRLDFFSNLGIPKLTLWALGAFDEEDPPELLEIGCGSGKNTSALLKRFPKTMVTAMDHSPLTLEKTTERNRAAIQEGRCRVIRDEEMILSPEPEKYDLAVILDVPVVKEKWEGRLPDLLPVLKTGGMVLIAAEAGGQRAVAIQYQDAVKGNGLDRISLEEYVGSSAVEILSGRIGSLLKEAGFSKIRCRQHESRPWVMITASRGGELS